MAARLVAFVTMLAVLASCGGRPIGVMTPTGQVVAGTTPVSLLVATTRAPSDDKAILFGGERGTGLKVDAVTVSIPPDANRKAGQVQWPKKLPADPLKDFTTISVAPVTSEAETRSWIRQHSPKDRRVLVFVHGFNNRYEESVYRFAQIVHDSGTDVVPVVFTWPSRASIFDYNYDKESTNYSRDALEEMLTRLAKDSSVSDITVMAHSMGTWLAVEALRQMAIRNKRVLPKINNVILAAPDLDVDVFGRQYASLGKDKPKFTLFVSQDDRALSLSRRISGNVDRLGQIDPSAEPYRSELEKAGITVLDLTKLQSGDRLNHGKFAESPEVVRLIGDRLIAGQTVTDSDVGLGEAIGAVGIGAAQTVGTAASVAISAPIAVFDPRTRENYGRQVERLGRSVENTVGSVGDTATSVVDPQANSGRRASSDCSQGVNRGTSECRDR
ncbi:alpha/beta hydrolase [Agrobacterium larrymoorei]|uniref:Alpha/beta fold hydrolase n=1 Tax=Agrobacterium larrymoorei TaxID=160699 RepID=A0A4D7E2K8_9HYPH|nr:alpha/beta hydrolase [Agrobacterium larrymoorei]QCI98900.1 alpha/beta fold hydrolase [Agrobacterium larrymoorei]QYA08211.1 alpha/beta hydrolase [Agrobacterium larrymoorei]